MEKPLGKLFKALDVMREHESDSTALMIQVFLFVGMKDGCRTKEVCDFLGIAQSTGSSILALLGPWRKYQVAGMNFIDMKEDPMDRRKKTIHLTPKGKKVTNRLTEIMEA